MTEVPFIERVASEVLVADGGMGTMLQAAGLTLADFEDLEGCNEILNVTRPDVIADIHRAYFDVGVDSVQTNTFGTNWANLAEYGIEDRIKELALAGARIARDVADEYEAQDGRDRYVYGSIGPGTKLPSLGHTDFETLRDAYQQGSEGLLEGGVDLLLPETSFDTLNMK